MKKKLVVLTGAGISAESGISTFRDSGGLWEKYSVDDVCTPDGYRRNPRLVIDFYNARRKQLLSVQPNHAHIALAEPELTSIGSLISYMNLKIFMREFTYLTRIIRINGRCNLLELSMKMNNMAAPCSFVKIIHVLSNHSHIKHRLKLS